MIERIEALTQPRKLISLLAAAVIVLGPNVAPAYAAPPPATPIEHLVVIFNENISFDHYFGTYPNATNPAIHGAAHP